MAGTSAGARVVAVLLGGAVAGGLGYVVWQKTRPALEVAAVAEVAAEPGVTVAPVAEPAPVVIAAPAPEPEPVPEVVEAAPEPVAPALDVVRVDPDGATLIAGKAGANARVSLRLDGIEEAVTQADSAGNFVAQFTLQANPSPRMLTVAVLLDDGRELSGDAAVAIAPIAAPASVAAAEPAAPAAIMVTEDAVSVVQEAVPAAPELAANVTVDTIAYAPDGAVLLSGRGQAGAGVRLYLDNAPVMDAPVGADGKWAVTLPETAPAIYTLRVDQVAADGQVSSRFETPFKRETLTALAVAAGQVVASPDAVTEPDIAVTADVVAEPAPVAEAAAETAPGAVVEAVVEPAPGAVAEAVVEAAPEVVAEAVVAPAPKAAVAPAAKAVAETVVEPAPVAVAVAEPAPEPVAVVAASAPPAPMTITVQPGFTLWGIADSMMGDGVMYVQVFEMNRDKIRDPDLIYPGQVFMVPQK